LSSVFRKSALRRPYDPEDPAEDTQPCPGLAAHFLESISGSWGKAARMTVGMHLSAMPACPRSDANLMVPEAP
jgi:hypothetical protein